jgi:hypothetical protein
VNKKHIIAITIMILICLALGYKIISDNRAIESKLREEAKLFIIQAMETQTLIIDGGDNPYHKDMSTDYLEITDPRIDSRDKLSNLMADYFTEEYSGKRLNQLYFEKDNKLCKYIVDEIRIYNYNTAKIGDVSISTFTKDAILELYVYSPIHNKVNSIIFRLKSIDGEYRIDEYIGRQ